MGQCMTSEGRTIGYSGFHKGPGTKFDEADPFVCLRNLDLPDTDAHWPCLASLTRTNGEGKSWLRSTSKWSELGKEGK